MRVRRRPILALLLILAMLATSLYAWRQHRRAAHLAIDPGLRRAPEPRSLPADRQHDRLRVLFIGNSFTNYWGGVPWIATALTRTTPDWHPDRPPLFEEVTYGGATLRSHWDATTAASRVREGAWDYVVLQGHSQEPLLAPADFRAYARRFADEARRVGARPVLFMTWPRVEDAASATHLFDAYESLGRELDADVVPVGLAYAAAGADPAPRLIEADGRHPTHAGAYLTACCFYSFFYDRPATGATAAVDDPLAPDGRWINLDPALAAKLQSVAYDAVRAWRAAHPRGGPAPVSEGEH